MTRRYLPRAGMTALFASGNSPPSSARVRRGVGAERRVGGEGGGERERERETSETGLKFE